MPAPNIYPLISQILADLDMRRADKEKESAEICGLIAHVIMSSGKCATRQV